MNQSLDQTQSPWAIPQYASPKCVLLFSILFYALSSQKALEAIV